MIALPVLSASLALLIAGGAPQRVEGEVAYWNMPAGGGMGAGKGAGAKPRKPGRAKKKVLLAGVEVRFIPAAALEPVMKARIARAKREIAAARPGVAELAAAASNAQGEALRALQAASEGGEDPAVVERWNAASQASGEAIARYQEARDVMLAPARGPYYLADLPPARAVATSDAGGKFSLDLEPGKYAAVASARRHPGDPQDTLFWLLWVRVGGGRQAPVALGSDNLMGTSCKDCVVPVRQLTRGLP